MQKERVKINFLGQDVPNDMHCRTIAVSKVDFVYKQGKKLLQVYVKEFKYIDPENQ